MCGYKFLSLIIVLFSTSLQPLDFPNPHNVDPKRPKASYSLNGTGFHGCPGVTYAEQTIAEIVKVVFKLKNVRRAPGDAGKLAGFTTVVNETETNVFITPNGTTSPWPGSMYIVVSASDISSLIYCLFLLLVRCVMRVWALGMGRSQNLLC